MVVALSYLNVLVWPFSRNTLSTFGINELFCWVPLSSTSVTICCGCTIIDELYSGAPFTTTPSAKRTLGGLLRNFAFFAAVNKADFLVVYKMKSKIRKQVNKKRKKLNSKKGKFTFRKCGWRTTKVTDSSQDLQSK